MTKSMIFKVVLCLILTSVILLSAIGCDTITPPSHKNDNNNFNDNIINNGDNNIDTDNNNNDNSESKKEKYSAILQNILNNEYYNEMIEKAKTNKELYNDGIFKPHPYAFLEDEGFDIDAIKNGSIDCYTMSYVLDEDPNSLYMNTRVTENDVVYTYLVRYELTNQEMSEYTLLHNASDPLLLKYVQAMFINNTISEMKTPEIVGTSQMSVEAYEGMTKSMNGLFDLSTKTCDIIMINPNQEERYFNLLLIPKYDKGSYFKNNSIVDLDCLAQVRFDGEVFTGPYLYGVFFVENEETLKAKLYLTQKIDLTLFCGDLNESLS